MRAARADARTIIGRLEALNDSIDRALELTLGRLGGRELLEQLPEAGRRVDLERLARARQRVRGDLESPAGPSWDQISRPSLADLARNNRTLLRRA